MVAFLEPNGAGYVVGDISDDGRFIVISRGGVLAWDRLTPTGPTLKHAYRRISADDTATIDDDYIDIDATAGPITLTLPDIAAYPVGVVGLLYVLRKDATANVVTLDGHAAQQIEGLNTAPSTFANTQVLPPSACIALMADKVNVRWVIAS